jgi:hypothetical protein
MTAAASFDQTLQLLMTLALSAALAPPLLSQAAGIAARGPKRGADAAF